MTSAALIRRRFSLLLSLLVAPGRGWLRLQMLEYTGAASRDEAVRMSAGCASCTATMTMLTARGTIAGDAHKEEPH